MRMEHLRFEVKAILGKVDIDPALYNDLRIGDILILDQKIGEPLSIEISNEPWYSGRPGLHETHKALAIHDRLHDR